MAIGDTVQAGLMRIDTSAYERAGQANANANMAFGNALNQVAKGFIEGREKKARANEIKEELMRQGVPEDAAGNISKNPFLQKERARQEAAKQQMQIEGNRIAVQREGIRSSARSASDSNALKSRSMDMAQEGVDAREAKIAEAEQAKGDFLGKFYSSVPTGEMNEAGQEELANFEAFAAPEDPRTNPFIQETLQNPEFQQTEPVMDMTGNRFAQQFADKSPEVQQLALNFMQANAPKPMTPIQVQEYNINAAKELREQTDFNERNQNPSENLSVGQETIDREFAKDIVSFNPADINKGLTQLREATARLGGEAIDEDGNKIEQENLTGAMIGLMPDAFIDIVNPQASEVKEAVEEVVQRNLRLVLGAQFTEKEGQRLISRAYNQRLSETENKKRVDRLIKSIDGAMQQKQDQARYFNEKGTLKGYQFAPVSIESIERDAFDGSTTQPSANTIDPADLENAIQAKRKQLEQRTMMQQTLDNPNVPNYGSQ